MSASGPAHAIPTMPGAGDDQATFRLLMSSLGSFLGDLDRARGPELIPGAILGRPISTWHDADHLYLEGQFRFQADAGHDVGLRVLEGNFIISLDRDSAIEGGPAPNGPRPGRSDAFMPQWRKP